MKILKYSLIMLLFTIFGCNSDQNNLDISEVEEEEGNTYKTNSVSAYSLEEILMAFANGTACETIWI